LDLRSRLIKDEANVNVANVNGAGTVVKDDLHLDPSKRLIEYVFFDDIEDEDIKSDDDMEDFGSWSYEDNDSKSLTAGNGNGNDASAKNRPSSTNAKGNNYRNAKGVLNPPSHNKKTTDQLQKEQEETLEHEITQMATQLKQSSLSIKATLASQNSNLTEMETLAQANLDRTKDITDKVEERVRASGWRKSVKRWITFFNCFRHLGVLFFDDKGCAQEKGGLFVLLWQSS